MAANEALPRGEQFYIAAPVAANSGVGPNSGDPLIWGLANSPSNAVALVAETSYTPPGSLTPTGNISVKRIGAFFLSVAAKTSINPGTGQAINPGDAIYADGGTIDTTTGILYGFTLNRNSTTGWLYGHAMDAVTSGQTETIRVLIGAK